MSDYLWFFRAGATDGESLIKPRLAVAVSNLPRKVYGYVGLLGLRLYFQVGESISLVDYSAGGLWLAAITVSFYSAFISFSLPCFWTTKRSFSPAANREG